MPKTNRTAPRTQSRGYRITNAGRVTRRFRNMETGEWFAKPVRANSAVAVAAILRANARGAA
jgi:hypothetical protein